MMASPSASARPSTAPRRGLPILAGLLLAGGLAWFYYAAAAGHARVVNVSRVRADQSGYGWDAVAVYWNWQGRPPVLVGERNRMPIYPGFLALFYDPGLTPDQFFEIGKTWNIRLSLVLLALLFIIFRKHLPPIAAVNLTLVIAFGYFVFKAGYMQAELLFYFLVFCTFLSFCYFLEARRPAASLGLAVLAGALAGVTHLTKAAILPLVAVLLGVYGLSEAVRVARGWRRGERRGSVTRAAWRGVAALLFTACFLAVLYPYISNSKRVFGRYFYNVNTTFYAWYDDWPQASIGTYSHGDGVGWPTLPPQQIPSMRKYWRQHTLGEMAARIGDGMAEMVTVSYRLYLHLKYIVIFVFFALVVMATRWREFRALIRAHAPLFAFMALYAVVYVLAIAFYKPVSTTTSRMLLAHVAPLLFVLSCFFTRPPFRETRWQVAGATVTPAHFHLLVTAMIGLDLVFTLRGRLMADFAGY